MVTLMLKTKQSGNIVYDNKGSAERLTNYLKHEANANNFPYIYFFNHTETNVKPDHVLHEIDNNIRR